jgi:hypothetical protein
MFIFYYFDFIFFRATLSSLADNEMRLGAVAFLKLSSGMTLTSLKLSAETSAIAPNR